MIVAAMLRILFPFAGFGFKRTLKASVASIVLCLAFFLPQPTAQAVELLSNGGFEAGDLTGWTETAGAGEGHVVTISGLFVQTCQQIDPNVPQTGNFLFSAGVPDGATPGTDLIVLSQSIDISSYAGHGVIEASGYFSGSTGCNTSTSDDLATLVVELYSNGGTTLLTTVTAGPLDPMVGFWNPLSTGSIAVPAGADTLVLRVSMALAPGFASIDLGVDDVSVTATAVPTCALNCPAGDADAVTGIQDRSPDLDGDGAVDLVDLAIFAQVYPPNPPSLCADLDCDSVIGLIDLALFALHYNHAGGPGACN